MKVARKLRILSAIEWASPIRILRWKSYILHRSFENDISIARAKKEWDEVQSLESERYWEVSEYRDRILSIQHKRLRTAADKYFVHIPDLVWERSDWGDRYLNPESAAKLYAAVQDLRLKEREYQTKLIGAVTGIVGALIGLVAVWKKH